jgi:hypothetical protein
VFVGRSRKKEERVRRDTNGFRVAVSHLKDKQQEESDLAVAFSKLISKGNGGNRKNGTSNTEYIKTKRTLSLLFYCHIQGREVDYV